MLCRQFNRVLRLPICKRLFSDAIINEKITAAQMRVVFPADSAGKTEWKILSKADALLQAKKLKLDLVLVNAVSDPVVCRLENYFGRMKEKKAEQKENNVPVKAKVTKEMYIKSNIDPHDFETKINRIKEFLQDGNPVKVGIISKKTVAKSANPNILSAQQVRSKLLELGQAPEVQVVEAKSPMSNRMDFMISVRKAHASPSVTTPAK